MPLHTPRRPTTARQRLVEAEDSPVAPPEAARRVVRLLDGARINADLDADDWLGALAVADGTVAVYFALEADHEWWLAYDATVAPDVYSGDLDGPWHLWSTYPRGAWDHQCMPREHLRHNLGELYWEGDPEDRCDIYRSRVVCIEDAPSFVQEAVRDD